jgi:hypothetical protein
VPVAREEQMMPNHAVEIPVGRLLRANATTYTLGCRISETDLVRFGSLVRAGSRAGELDIYGLVYDITVVDDLMVKQLAISAGMTEEQRRDQLERRQVPIEMSVLAVGYRENGAVHRRIPPRPPLSLDRVSLCSPEEIRRVTDKLGYLRLILRQRIGEIPIEQLIVAHIVLAYEARGQDNAWALRAAGELIAQLRDDYRMLLPLLEALGDALPQLEGGLSG